MRRSRKEPAAESGLEPLVPYVIELELEVDRLRRQSRFVEQQAWVAVRDVQNHCQSLPDSAAAGGAKERIKAVIDGFATMLVDLHQHPGYHPAHDQVVPIAVRPLVEQVFRWQQRMAENAHVVLRLELEVDHVDWFPSRLRHIVDNLLANAMRHGAAAAGETRIVLAMRRSAKGYELRVSDNGTIIHAETRLEMLDVIHRATSGRGMELGVGLAVAKTLIEQSGGTLTVQANGKMGTSFLVFLPRYDIDDFLENQLET